MIRQVSDRNPVHAIIAASIFMFLLQGLIGFIVLTAPEVPADSAFAYINVIQESSFDVCPGDTLTCTLGMRYKESGVFEIDITTWRKTPPRTVIFSESRRVVISEPVEFFIDYEWTVPQTYFVHQLQQDMPFSPGEYERRHAVTTSSRSTEPAIVIVPFTIKENCND